MISSKWTPEEEQLVRYLIATNSHQEISEEITRRVEKGLQGFTRERSADAVRHKCEREQLTATAPAAGKNQYEQRWADIISQVDEYRAEHEVVDVGILPGGTVLRKILSISDLHLPFTRMDVVQAVLEEHADADIVVVNGDLLDGHMYSTFPKSKRLAAIVEYRIAFQLIQFLSENFPKVVIVEGNHDVRPARALKHAGFDTPDTSTLFRPNLLARIANGEELDEFGDLVKKHAFDNVIFQPMESWYVKIGHTLFVHPHGWAGSQPGANVMKIDQLFRDRFLGDTYDSIVIGHTHRCFKGIYNNRLLIEQGALCGRQDYENKADMKHLHAMNGYAVIYQDLEGNTDFNMSNFVYLGSELAPKKAIVC